MNNKFHYFKNLVMTKAKSELLNLIQDSPLKPKDIEFLSDIVRQLSYKELKDKYRITADGIYKKKVRCINRFIEFYLSELC